MPNHTSPPSGRTRFLREDDLLAVAAVIDGTSLFPSDLLPDMTAGFLSGSASDEFWLTLADPDPVAYCSPERLTDRTWNLLLIAVRPDRQGGGIGSALQGAVETHLAERGQRLLLVETSGLPEFEGTRAFYRRLGYAEEARIRNYYRDGEDKIVFAKGIGPVAP